MSEISLDDEDNMMDASAMAEAMGFSGFGMQRPPSKKRKFNPNADAAVSAAPPKNKPASFTGANSAPLGQRTRRAPSPTSDLPARPSATVDKTGTDEIDLDDEGDVNGEKDPNSRYIDTSRPARGYLPEEIAEIEAQEKIDAILAGSSGVSDLPARPPPPAHGGEGLGENDQQHQQQQQQQQPYGQQMNHQRGGRANYNRHHHHSAGKDPEAPWWEGYYDPKVNQNPWEVLEKKMGLQPRGTWLSRSAKLAEPGVGEQEPNITVEEKEACEDHAEETS